VKNDSCRCRDNEMARVSLCVNNDLCKCRDNEMARASLCVKNDVPVFVIMK
jgi:hypothetical protein